MIRSLLLVLGVLLLPGSLAAQRTDPLAMRTKGSANAPVTVYEMSDFQCPFCRRHSLETFGILDREYIATGKVRWIFINFPLTEIHPNAVAAAEFAMCAGRQGQFWNAHDILFRSQATWAPLRDPGAFLVSLADSLRLTRAPLGPVSREGGDEGGSAERRRGLGAGGSDGDADVLHRGWSDGWCPAEPGVPGGARLDHRRVCICRKITLPPREEPFPVLRPNPVWDILSAACVIVFLGCGLLPGGEPALMGPFPVNRTALQVVVLWSLLVAGVMALHRLIQAGVGYGRGDPLHP